MTSALARRRTWLLLVPALAWLWSAGGSSGAPLASISHAPHAPFGVTTFLGTLGALAAFHKALELADVDTDAPIMYPDTMWSERQLQRVSDWVRAADSPGGRLVRGLIGTPAIAALGIGFHGENGLRAWGEPFVVWGRS